MTKLEVADVNVGDLIAFQIDLIEGFSAPNFDRWGVLKVLRLGQHQSIIVSVIDFLSDHCPSPWQVRFRSVLLPRRFQILNSELPAPRSPPKPEIFETPFDDDINLRSARLIGREWIMRRAEITALKQFESDGFPYSISPIEFAAHSLDHEHRAVHDREKWIAEVKEISLRRDEEFKKREQLRRAMLNSITLDKIAAEPLFVEWEERAQIIPREFVTLVRERARFLLYGLGELGAKPNRLESRALLKCFVERLNEADGTYDYFIETEEREDLMGFLSVVCHAIKQQSLLEEIDSWRVW